MSSRSELTHSSEGILGALIIAEARDVTADLKNLLTRGGSILYHDVVWTAKGGKLCWEDTYVVDGAEVALEAANDAWASNIAAMEPEWAR